MPQPGRNALGHILPGSRALNPGGRPKGLERRVREIVGDDIDAMIGMLRDIALGRGAQAGFHIRDRLKAFELILDRGWGKARTTVDIMTGEPASSRALDVDSMTDAELEEYERRLEMQIIDVDSVPGGLAGILGDGR